MFHSFLSSKGICHILAVLPAFYDNNSVYTVYCTQTHHNLILTHISVLGFAACQYLMTIYFALQPGTGILYVPALTH